MAATAPELNAAERAELAALVREVDAARTGASLSSALRVHVLRAALAERDARAAGAERSALTSV